MTWLKRKSWNISDWVALAIVVCISIFGAWWYLTPSSDFINPVRFVLNENNIITFTRETPRGDVWARFSAEYRMEDGRTCVVRSDDRLYEQRENDTVHFPLSPNLRACFNGHRPVVYVSQHRAHALGGMVYLRPVTFRADLMVPDVPEPSHAY